MHLQVTRRGGLAGIPLRGEVDTATLPAAQTRAADAVLASLPGDRAPAGARHPDGFSYELSFGGRSVTLDETAIPAGLRPAIDAAMARATLD